MPPRLSLRRIEAASELIDDTFTFTPQYNCERLSQRLGYPLILKVETLNPLRSFKGRGADFFMRQLPAKPPRLVCASAGNFGQGLAYAARTHDIKLEVFAALQANPLKVAQMEALGATVHLHGHDLDAAKAAAKVYAHDNDLLFVEDGRDAAITEGAATIGLELSRWPAPLDALIVPVGNGALISGIGTWFKNQALPTRIIGVCASGAPAMQWSWQSGLLQTTPNVTTCADGIAVREPIPEALLDMRLCVDEVVLVDDAEMLQAMRWLLRDAGLLSEPAGAAGVAAAYKFRDRFAQQTVATVITGSNITPEQMQEWQLLSESL